MSSVIRGSDNFDSAAKSGTIEATASGAISAGDPVVVNSDGTVSAISGTGRSFESSVQYSAGATYGTDIVYDTTNNKVVVCYTDGANSSRGTAVVGSVSGSSISFGTPVVFETGSAEHISAVFDTTNSKIVIAYKDGGNSNRGTAVVGSVSGTSISFGTPVVFETGATYDTDIVHDTANNKVVIVYRDSGNSSKGTAIVGTVSGTSISFGTAVLFNDGDSRYNSVCFDSARDQVLIHYLDLATSQSGAVIGTVSGTSISFGSAVNFPGDSYNTCCYDPVNDKFLLSSYYHETVATVSGTTITLGKTYDPRVITLLDQVGTTRKTIFNPVINKIAYFSDRYSSDFGVVESVDISSGAPIYTEASVYGYTTIYNSVSACYDPDTQQFIVVAPEQNNGYVGTAVVMSLEDTNLSGSNYIGISDGAYSDGETATIPDRDWETEL